MPSVSLRCFRACGASGKGALAGALAGASSAALARELMRSLDDELKHEVSALAAYYEHRIQIGNKEIFHLEAFVAKFMSLYKNFVLSMFG